MSKSIKKNTVFNAIKTVSAIIFPLITFPYASRTLLVENIGKVNFGLSFISYFSLMASLGINVYAIRECAKFGDDRVKLSKIASEIFSINVFTTIFSYTILILCLLFYKKIESYRTLIVIQSLSILFTTLGTDWLNTAMEDFQYITIRSLLFQVLSLILLFTFIHKPDDYIKYAAISVISSSGYNIVNMIYRRKYCDIKFTLDIDIKKHYLPIIFLFVMLLSQTIFNNVDMTMLGIMKGDFEVGIYSTAHKISNIIAQLVTSVVWVILPRMSVYFGNNDKAAVNKLINQLYNFSVTIGLPIVVGIYMLSDDVITLFASKSFALSADVLKILILTTLLTILFGSLIGNMVLLPAKQEKFLMIVCVFTATFNFITNYILIPKFGAIGAAITTILSTILSSTLSLIKGLKFVEIKFVTRSVFSAFFGCALIVLVCFVLNNINYIVYRVILSVFISSLLYLIILFLLKNEIVLVFINSLKRIIRFEGLLNGK